MARPEHPRHSPARARTGRSVGPCLQRKAVEISGYADDVGNRRVVPVGIVEFDRGRQRR